MKISLIVNPNAGRKKGLDAAARVAALLEGAGIECTQFVSTRPGGTREIAESIVPSDWDGIVAVGGDGTLFEVVNGLLAHAESVPVPLGLIPVGTGNSFIKDLGIESVEDAVARIVARHTRRIDLGLFTSDAGTFWFANLLGVGFVSNVAYRARKYKIFGALSYVFAVFEELIGLKTTVVTLEIDGRIIECDALFVEICNSRFTGGNMLMAPDALIDDGELDVILVRRVNRRTVLKLLPTIFSGRHVEFPAVEVFRGRSIRLTSEEPLMLSPDGETFGRTPIDATVHHAKLEMFG
ncbi:MAG: diacylglycerol kinase family lipid kinase [Spirochaetaceae bacterium]|nr:MAG: diacylglycerol kinase family lipid kinase [Spirochaetaceae bacterium]